MSVGEGSAGSPLELHFLDVGYGDSILIRFPDGPAALVDAGGPDRGAEVCSALRRTGLMRLDYLILTHFHKDHAGGMLAVLREWEAESAAGEILLTHLPDTVHPEVEALAKALRGRPVRTVRRGDLLDAGPAVRVEILHPEKLTGDPNEDSLVLAIRHGDVGILLAGDIQQEAQRELIRTYGGRLRSDLLKIPHHASEGLPEFAEAVGAREAILSIGPNRRGSPDPDVLSFYGTIGCRIRRTDEYGTIKMVSDGRSVRMPEKSADPVGEEASRP
jgi:competence protein ComEC